ncbi:MAG TPA: PQQ-dependent sugar dehydrogenase, partial [Gemmatimonadetes bacterium]|nr:PQQ-dependent sugar dehydrogenase [Gemmatimonadota bacterium]
MTMVRTRFALAALGTCTLVGAPADAQINRSALHDFQIVSVAEGLETPWSMAWLPNGDMLITERPGRLRIVRDGQLLPDPVPGVPQVHARGQGGLLDVQPHPDFANNHLLYITYSKPQADDQSTTALIRGTFENDEFTNVEQLFEAVARGRNGHYGSRIAFADGYVFISAGDRQAPSSG